MCPSGLTDTPRYINYHIRSDTRNQLLLRTKMEEVDFELIRDVARGDTQREAVRALKEKIDREPMYKLMVPRYSSSMNS